MPKKLKPTAGQKRNFFLHLLVFLIATIIMVLVHKSQGASGEWVYPWHAWIIASWGLSLIGHWCAVYFGYEDKGEEEYKRQAKNG